MAQKPQVVVNERKKSWTERVSRSGYFFAALLFHLILFHDGGHLDRFPRLQPTEG